MFHGQNKQDKFIYERYFENKREGLAIECGAFDGLLESSTLFFEQQMGWKTICIEAYPEIFDSLCKNRPLTHAISLALSDTPGTVSFTHAVHPIHGKNFGNGSMSHAKEHKDDLIGQGCEFVEYSVKSDTYTNVIDQFMNDNNMQDRIIDLFVLDVEGNETKALQGMHGSKYLPRVLCVEYPISGIKNIDPIAQSLGYKLDCMRHNNAYYLLRR